MERPLTHTWRWTGIAPERHGHPCRIRAHHPDQHVTVEFEDGWQTIAPRSALQRIPADRPASVQARTVEDLTLPERTVLARLQLCATGTIGGYQPVGTKSGFDGGAPPRRDDLHGHHLAQMLAASTTEERDAALAAAERDLAHQLRRDPDATAGEDETVEQRADRIVRDTEGYSPKEVRQLAGFGMVASEREVIRARQAHGRDPQTGRVLNPDESWQDRARRLAEFGMSERQISEAIFGTPQRSTTVRRALGRAA